REGFAIAATLDAASALGDSIAQTRALAALDTLLKRVYARGFGVRHAMAGTVHGLLQDQVQVAAASVAAYNATGKPRYLEVAKNLADVLERDFADPQDADLSARILAGDGDAFGILVRRHEAGLLRFATRMLGSPDAAADAVAEALIRAYRHLASLDDPTRFRTWLYRIVANRCKS